MFTKDIKNILNYIGQLRIYSLLDFIVFSTALTNNISTIIAMTSLWCSFVLYLEYIHKDHLRLPVSFLAPLTLFIIPFFFLPFWIPLLFGLFSFLYTKKKHSQFFGITAPLWRACINATLTIAFNPALTLITVLIIFTRNFIADFRDAHYDKNNGTITLPVFLGYKKNAQWVFFAHPLSVMLSTLVWFHYSFINTSTLCLILFTQAIVYVITPRASTPAYLNFYKEYSHKEAVTYPK